MARLGVTESTATTMTVDGREVLAFGGCNYLGLAHHPEVVRALCEEAGRSGISTTASRETTGNTGVHEALEAALASWMGQEAAILLAEGYTANIALCQALARDHGVALIDAKAHRSLRSAATAAGMQVFEYEHRSPKSAAWLCRQYGDLGVAILTDGVFAADGALAPLPELLGVLPARRATLVVDDCHGVCVLGARGSGSVEHFGLRDERVAITTTLAKGVGCYGGAVIGRRRLVDAVREHADVYRRSTPVPTPLARAALTAVDLVAREPGMLARLRSNTARLRDGLIALGLASHEGRVPIFTFVLEPASRMQPLHEALMHEGVYAPLIEYPGGPTARFFRITVTATHRDEDIDRLVAGLRRHVGG
ncbi:MAG: 8-amino-7-oxononanoate synthase [Phycisphaerae bacterium]|nr:MAG: 8-amino-7-oxononanoate synthase [Phycisphaerae bacterium]